MAAAAEGGGGVAGRNGDGGGARGRDDPREVYRYIERQAREVARVKARGPALADLVYAEIGGLSNEVVEAECGAASDTRRRGIDVTPAAVFLVLQHVVGAGGRVDRDL